jgi:hypothetical protein
MRRYTLLLAVAGLMSLSGCATDRFAYARQDPLIWFLSGMPAPYDLDWNRGPIPDLPVLNPVSYVPVPAPPPLDYPRGWNPDNPPLLTIDNGTEVPAPQPAPVPVPLPDTRCDVAPCAVPATPEIPADPVPADARAAVRVDTPDYARASDAGISPSRY